MQVKVGCFIGFQWSGAISFQLSAFSYQLGDYKQ